MLKAGTGVKVGLSLPGRLLASKKVLRRAIWGVILGQGKHMEGMAAWGPWAHPVPPTWAK